MKGKNNKMDGKPTHTHLAEKKEKKSKRKPKAP